MIRKLSPADFDAILAVVNDAAQVYKGVIPQDRWQEPYMPASELRSEIEGGVEFHGWLEKGVLLAVMGIQSVNDVTLIRHAYVLTAHQRRGIGEKLLRHLMSLAGTATVLVGTWEAACGAVRFYEKNGFVLLSREETATMLRKYWRVPERQVETSVVLKLKE